MPTDARLLHAAIRAWRDGTASGFGNLAAMIEGRYAHAKPFKRHQRQLRVLCSRPGRITGVCTSPWTGQSPPQQQRHRE
ncbi:hypothetical protein ACVWZL_009071 [Bradyrhizobium sp. GM2.4]